MLLSHGIRRRKLFATDPLGVLSTATKAATGNFDSTFTPADNCPVKQRNHNTGGPELAAPLRRDEASRAVALAKRPGDWPIIAFFAVNLLFITYIVDLEQLVIADPTNFVYPVWPPPAMVDLVHWWGRTFDPVLLARPTWWKMTIWIDVLFFGPFYVFGIYAFAKGRNWIRLPGLIYASVMLTNVAIILGEEAFGPHRTPRLGIVLLANAPWVIVPVYLLYRLGRGCNVFTVTDKS